MLKLTICSAGGLYSHLVGRLTAWVWKTGEQIQRLSAVGESIVEEKRQWRVPNAINGTCRILARSSSLSQPVNSSTRGWLIMTAMTYTRMYSGGGLWFVSL